MTEEKNELERQFDKCPCGSEDTLGKRMWKDKIMPEGLPCHMKAEITPIPFSVIAGKCVICFYDTCAECGQSFLVKSMVKVIPTQMNPQRSPLMPAR